MGGKADGLLVRMKRCWSPHSVPTCFCSRLPVTSTVTLTDTPEEPGPAAAVTTG